MPSNKRKPVSVYDLKDSELCVGVFCSSSECARYFNTTPSHVRNNIRRGSLLKKQYQIMYVGK